MKSTQEIKREISLALCSICNGVHDKVLLDLLNDILEHIEYLHEVKKDDIQLRGSE